MGKKEFDDFINGEARQDVIDIDWGERLEIWKSFLTSLYKNINLWLKEYLESGKIKIEARELEIYEDAIGKYTVPSMTLSVGKNLVYIKPYGTILIGTIGRVDIICKNNTQKIILADKNANAPRALSTIDLNSGNEPKSLADKYIDWEWKLTTNPPNIKYSSLNQDSFYDCLMEVING
jgi:hypothetical protein